MKTQRFIKTSSLSLAATFFLLTMTSLTWGQISLGTSPFTENFDGVGAGLPTGFTVRTGATATNLGTTATFVTTQTTFGSATGQFANYASADGLTSASTPAQQNASTDRVIGLRQTGTFGDPGAAFVLQLAKTTGKSSFSLAFKFQTLSEQTRDTTFTVDYGLGASPTTFTPVTTVTSGTFGSQTVTANFGTALDNQSGPVFIRIVALTGSSGTTGSRDTVAIDDLSLAFTSPTAATVNLSGRVLSANGRGISRAVVSMTDGDGNRRLAFTNNFGYYLFENVQVGQTVILDVRSKWLSFTQPTQVIVLTEDATTVNFRTY